MLVKKTEMTSSRLILQKSVNLRIDMKYLIFGSLLLSSITSFASELPDSLKSCKFQNIYSDNALTEVIINDNIS